MTLLRAKHADPLSAAVSIAENRASKVRLLRAEGLDRIADGYTTDLFYDVLQFVGHEYAELAHGEQVPDHVCERLHAAVASARVAPCTACGSIVVENGHCACCGRQSAA